MAVPPSTSLTTRRGGRPRRRCGRVRRRQRRPGGRPAADDADQARRRHLRREPVVRPLLRHLSGRRQPARAAAFTGSIGTPTIDGLDTGPARQPTRTPPSRAGSTAPRPSPATSEPQLRRRAEGVQRRRDGQVRREHRRRRLRRTPAIVMAYYDGNTVTALWNYAQHFAMSDSALRHHVRPVHDRRDQPRQRATPTASAPPARVENGTMIANSQPASTTAARRRRGHDERQNIGDLMNAAGVTWGWFAGGFRPTVGANGATRSAPARTRTPPAATSRDYLPHHMPFQYYASTANPHHLPPTSVAKIGTTDQANHQYDLTDFDAALAAGNLPQVSFLKAVGVRGRAPGLLGPARRAALHRAHDQRAAGARRSGTRRPSSSPTTTPTAGTTTSMPTDPAGLRHAERRARRRRHVRPAAGRPATTAGRCGPGPRLPLLVVSPYARRTSSTTRMTEQASITRFIEDNWGLGAHRRPVLRRARRAARTACSTSTPARAAPKLDARPRDRQPAGAPVVRRRPTATPTHRSHRPPVADPEARRSPSPKLAIKLSCKVIGRRQEGHRSRAQASGKDAGKKTALRFRIVKGKKVLATQERER